MDWKYDSTEAAYNISAYYSTNYIFTYILMPEDSYIKNAKLKKQQQRSLLFVALLLSS